jgi:hypothetical protein
VERLLLRISASTGITISTQPDLAATFQLPEEPPMFSTARLTCVLALGAIALSAQTIPVDYVRTTAMAGIAAGQTARLNLLNPGVLPPALGVVCTATVTYYDGSGAVRKTAPVTVAPGTSQFVDLHSDSDLSLAANTRAEIRATIAQPLILPPSASATSAESTSKTPVPACQLVTTLEIFDNITLRTEAVVGKDVEVN